MLNSLQSFFFRNLFPDIYFFKEGLNIITGDNAQGKTNLLEAIDLTLTGKSFRKEASFEDFLSLGSENKIIKFKYVYKNNIFEKKISFEKTNTKKIQQTFVIEPNYYFLFITSNQKKRDWFDEKFSLLSLEYKKILLLVKKLFIQKSFFLKLNDRQGIKIIHQQLVDLIYNLVLLRIDLVKKINNFLFKFFNSLFTESGFLQLTYKTDFTSKDKIFTTLEQNLQKELFTKKLEKTLSLDKYIFSLNDISVESYCSLSQRKMIFLSCSFSWIALFQEIFEESPIILFDDFLSEIDIQRRRNLIEQLKTYPQVFLTKVSEENYLKVDGHTFVLKEGKLHE